MSSLFKKEKKKVVSETRRHKWELKDLQAGEKHLKIYHTKKQSQLMKERQFFLENFYNKKEEKNYFETHSRFAFMSHISSWYLRLKEGC